MVSSEKKSELEINLLILGQIRWNPLILGIHMVMIPVNIQLVKKKQLVGTISPQSSMLSSAPP